MRLSIVTVVFNDLDALKRTVSSVKNILSENIEYWVIDGDSSDGTQDFLKSDGQEWINWISEPDEGLYDAMNKSLTKVSGDFVVFINAGDLLVEDFSWSNFIGATEQRHRVLLGYTIERYNNDRYLNPGTGKERAAFKAPQHQATFYPRIFFAKERYRMDRPISADGEYTSRAIHKYGAVFIPQKVCEFSVGGLSSNYGSMKVLRLRWSEVENITQAVKLLTKIILWNMLPRRSFYWLLARGKYTQLRSDVALTSSPLLACRTICMEPSLQDG